MAHEKIRPEFLFDEEKIKQLKQIAPECFEDGKINFETLRQNLGDWVENDEEGKIEHFGLFWPGKKEARQIAAIPPEGTLEPVYGEGLKSNGTPDTDGKNDSKNIFIEGENLEVLKILQKSYANRIKMIYIDPPYNTGNDFVYDDNFTEPLQEYLRRTGQVDEEGKPLTTNKKSDGRFHSKWLSMMYPRLRLARNLLKEDGFIFVSIDENEAHHLRCLMNEVFGEENFIEAITWNKRVPKNDKGIGNIHETILLFVKNEYTKPIFKMPKEGLDEVFEFVEKLKKKSIPIPEAEKELKKFYNKKGYDRGITLYNSLDKDYRIWGKINVSWPNSNTEGPRYDVMHPSLNVPVKVPDRGWRWKKETFDDLLDYENIVELHDGSFMVGKIWFDKNENTQPSSIKYLDEVNDLLLRSILSLKSDGGIEVEKYLGKNIFSYPKPTKLLRLLIKSNIEQNDIILDFFAGSSTLGDAISQINNEEEINLNFIQIQLPEKLEENNKEHKTAYKYCIENNLTPNLFQVSRSRLIKAIQSRKKSIGFRRFKLIQSNYKKWQDYQGTDVYEATLQFEEFTENPLREDWNKPKLITELMLLEGFPLDSIQEEFVMGKNQIVRVESEMVPNVLLICLDKEIEENLVENLELESNTTFVCFDNAISTQNKLRLSDKGLIKTI
jgi:adenine-specific DNA-methyltransferase